MKLIAKLIAFKTHYDMCNVALNCVYNRYCKMKCVNIAEN